jgi:DNA-binding winged helix-turn-helix (wHTH) protein
VPDTNDKRICFSVFEIRTEARELRKHGIRVKLEEQPFLVLLALLESPGAVLTRAELRKQIWPEGTFVDFDKGLNKAINKVRSALSDSATTPRFVETLSRRGYRFIAPVSITEVDGQGKPIPEVTSGRSWWRIRACHALAVVAVTAVIVVGIFGKAASRRLFGPSTHADPIAGRTPDRESDG